MTPQELYHNYNWQLNPEEYYENYRFKYIRLNNITKLKDGTRIFYDNIRCDVCGYEFTLKRNNFYRVFTDYRKQRKLKSYKYDDEYIHNYLCIVCKATTFLKKYCNEYTRFIVLNVNKRNYSYDGEKELRTKYEIKVHDIITEKEYSFYVGSLDSIKNNSISLSTIMGWSSKDLTPLPDTPRYNYGLSWWKDNYNVKCVQPYVHISNETIFDIIKLPCCGLRKRVQRTTSRDRYTFYCPMCNSSGVFEEDMIKNFIKKIFPFLEVLNEQCFEWMKGWWSIECMAADICIEELKLLFEYNEKAGHSNNSALLEHNPKHKFHKKEGLSSEEYHNTKVTLSQENGYILTHLWWYEGIEAILLKVFDIIYKTILQYDTYKIYLSKINKEYVKPLIYLIKQTYTDKQNEFYSLETKSKLLKEIAAFKL